MNAPQLLHRSSAMRNTVGHPQQTAGQLVNKRRAVAVQTARSRCKFQHALFRETYTGKSSTWVGVSIKIVISATWHESTDAFSVLHATISITEAGPRPLFPANSKRLQYTKTQLNYKDDIVRKIYCRVASITNLLLTTQVQVYHYYWPL